jgi:hypothetical protein
MGTVLLPKNSCQAGYPAYGLPGYPVSGFGVAGYLAGWISDKNSTYSVHP